MLKRIAILTDGSKAPIATLDVKEFRSAEELRRAQDLCDANARKAKAEKDAKEAESAKRIVLCESKIEVLEEEIADLKKVLRDILGIEDADDEEVTAIVEG